MQSCLYSPDGCGPFCWAVAFFAGCGSLSSAQDGSFHRNFFGSDLQANLRQDVLRRKTQSIFRTRAHFGRFPLGLP